MITAIVNFKLPEGTTREQARELYEASVPRFEGLPGLIRKYYLYGEDGTGGGAYLWESREAAEAVYTGEWRKAIEERYGVAPTIAYFDTDVIVDNTRATAAAAE